MPKLDVCNVQLASFGQKELHGAPAAYFILLMLLAVSNPKAT
jgi:hypothetical protein